jgi:chitodextrinase
VQLERKSSKMTLEEQASLWKNLDLSKEQLPANIDTKNVQVTVDKVTIKVNFKETK